MKVYTWNDAKNEILQSTRQISFEDIILHIEKGYLLDVLEHPNQEKYPGQKVFVVHVDQYAYLVPFVEDENTIFLKTIIPSRKATSLYMKGK